MSWYFLFMESFRSSVLSLNLPTHEEGEWVKSTMICCDVSLLAIVLSLAKALACPAARQMTIFRFILLRLSLGRSSFCSWAKEELIFSLPITAFTWEVEPKTRVFRVVLPPLGVKTFLPLLKQHRSRVEEQSETTITAAREITKKKQVK